MNSFLLETSLRFYFTGHWLRELGKQLQKAGINQFPAGDNTACQGLSQGPPLSPPGVLPGSGGCCYFSAVEMEPAFSSQWENSILLFLKLFSATQLLTEGGQMMGVSCIPQINSPSSLASFSPWSHRKTVSWVTFTQKMHGRLWLCGGWKPHLLLDGFACLSHHSGHEVSSCSLAKTSTVPFPPCILLEQRSSPS